MSEYNIKVSKLEDNSYKLKINNYSRYEVEEVEALAIKYLQKQLQQKENIIKEVREIFKYYGTKEDIVGYSNYTITGEDLIKLLEILDKENIDNLNDNVEITEEKKIPEKLKHKDFLDNFGGLAINDDKFIDKINEIIDYLKENNGRN